MVHRVHMNHKTLMCHTSHPPRSLPSLGDIEL
jgi:hypothetical protein